MRVLGNGEIDLGGQSIDYRLTARAVQSLAGQGGELDLQGLEVPVRLRGGFNSVSAGIDFEAVARNLLRQQAGRLIGGQTGESGDGEEPATPEDVVRGLFGQLLNNARNDDDDAADEPTDGDDEQGDAPN